jgi:hypothetical protein
MEKKKEKVGYIETTIRSAGMGVGGIEPSMSGV